MSKICITGAAGYIGSMLCPALLGDDHEVVAIDNFARGAAGLIPLCGLSSFRVIKEDVQNWESIRRHIEWCDIFIPLAALVGAPICEGNSSTAFSVNAEAIRAFVGNKPTIYLNTNAGYKPQSGKPCDESTPMIGESAYARSKIRAEQYVLEAGGISLRLGAVFGVSPNMRDDVLLHWIIKRAVQEGAIILSQPQVKRVFVHISDVVDAIRFFIDHIDLGGKTTIRGQAYNLNLPSLTKLELCLRIRNTIPTFYWFEDKFIYVDPDARDFDVDCSKLAEAGFVPDASIDSGITELAKAYSIL